MDIFCRISFNYSEAKFKKKMIKLGRFLSNKCWLVQCEGGHFKCSGVKLTEALSCHVTN